VTLPMKQFAIRVIACWAAAASVCAQPTEPTTAPIATVTPASRTPPGLPKNFAVPKSAAEASPPIKIKVDAAIPPYRKAASLDGTVRSIGSSTLSNLLLRWTTEFKLLYPGVEVVVTGGGSDSAPTALLAGTAELAPMSRPMRATEIAAFKAKFGYEPVRITVGLDAIAVYVNKNNPLKNISLKQLDGIFSATHRRGSEPLKTWGQLGLPGDWQEREIELKGPGRAQGIYSLFREMVLEGGEFRFDMRAEPVASSIVQGVGTSDAAIGFASYFYDSQRTRPLAISATGEAPFTPPDQASVVSGAYPLARSLYVYVNKPALTGMNKAAAEFLRYICSNSGQELSARDGNYPLSATLAKGECLAPLEGN
jgi:phosphate transport system substrate-binding protein